MDGFLLLRAPRAGIMRSAADDEDGIEKLPLTPGPILPAREQWGDLLLEQGNRAAASRAFKTALVNAPGGWEPCEGPLRRPNSALPRRALTRTAAAPRARR